MAVDTDISQSCEYLVGSPPRACVQTMLLSVSQTCAGLRTQAQSQRRQRHSLQSLLAWRADYPGLANSEVDSQGLSGAVRPGKNPVGGGRDNPKTHQCPQMGTEEERWEELMVGRLEGATQSKARVVQSLPWRIAVELLLFPLFKIPNG